MILEPAMDRLKNSINAGSLELHQVFGANLFLAHAVDYLLAIRKADGFKEDRIELVRQFDETYSVDGARFSNRKFELIDAINNALKHIRLNPKRYRHLEQKYGPISFQSLVEEKGRVLCILEGYRFDYVRVVLRPALEAITSSDLDAQEALDFARGEFTVDWSDNDSLMTSNEPSDAIDQMIENCNPLCADCGEGQSECSCAEFVYDGDQGRFEPRFRADFDFDEVMSRISGAYQSDHADRGL